MTKTEYEKFYYMEPPQFEEIKNPTAEQCLVFLRGFGKCNALHYQHLIPKKYRAACETQLKLEGL